MKHDLDYSSSDDVYSAYPVPEDIDILTPEYREILKTTDYTDGEKRELIANLRSLARDLVRIYLEENGAPVSDDGELFSTTPPWMQQRTSSPKTRKGSKKRS